MQYSHIPFQLLYDNFINIKKMISNKHQFTIFTPCYNGEKTIQRVFDSVESQTYTDLNG